MSKIIEARSRHGLQLLQRLLGAAVVLLVQFIIVITVIFFMGAPGILGEAGTGVDDLVRVPE